MGRCFGLQPTRDRSVAFHSGFIKGEIVDFTSICNMASKGIILFICYLLTASLVEWF